MSNSKTRATRKILSNFPLYIFFFAIYPALFSFAHNITEIEGWMIIRPLLISLLVMAISLSFSFLVLRSCQKAAIQTLIMLLIFFSYGQIYSLRGNDSLFFEPIIRHRYLVCFSIIMWIGAGLLIRSNEPSKLILPLNVITFALLLMPCITIFSYESHRIQNDMNTIEVQSSDIPQLDLTISDNPPDIYYIILDTYTRNDVLENRFGYDNSTFTDNLIREGLYVGGCSRSNYAQTLLSLNSSLNISFIPNLEPEVKSIDDLSRMLNNNIVYRTLRKNNYKLYTFDSGFLPTNVTIADEYLSPKTRQPLYRLLAGFQSFEAMFYNTTAFKIILDYQESLPTNIQQFINSPYSEVRDTIFYQLDQVSKIPEGNSPKIIHSHILAPHPPASFDSQGQPVDGVKYFTLNPDLTQKRDFARKAFVDEVNYLNERIIENIRLIKQNTNRPLVIIIQGDHGTYGFGTGDEHDRIKILNAYYFSDGDYSMLYPGISPINTFRVIFNKYFDAGLPLLPDDTYYYSAYDDRFDFKPIQENYPPCVE